MRCSIALEVELGRSTTKGVPLLTASAIGHRPLPSVSVLRSRGLKTIT